MSLWFFTEFWFCKTKCEIIQDEFDLIVTWSSWRAVWHFVPTNTMKCRALPYVTLADFLVGHSSPGSPWDLVAMTGRTTPVHLNACSLFFTPGEFWGGALALPTCRSLMQPCYSLALSQLGLFCTCMAVSFWIAPLHDAGVLPVQQREQGFGIPILLPVPPGFSLEISCSQMEPASLLGLTGAQGPMVRLWARNPPTSPHAPETKGLLPLCNCKLL